jgi:hypothetical protein
MNSITANRFSIASSLVLLAILLSSPCVSAQIPKLFRKFMEEQNRVQSGYAKYQEIHMTDGDTTYNGIYDSFFISTPKDLKYLSYLQASDRSNIYAKTAYAAAAFYNLKFHGYAWYGYYDDIYIDAKNDVNYYQDIPFSTAYSWPMERYENGTFQRIPPKIDKKNIRYKILHPDDEIFSDEISEYEFDRKTFEWVQSEYWYTYIKTERKYNGSIVFEQRLYDHIHPDILDTISFKFEELKKEYDKQTAVKQAKEDSAFLAHFCDSIVRLVTKNSGTWAEEMPQETQTETRFFMPEWKFPSLSGDTIHSDRINSRFMLIDMWYISCYPCMMAMRELATMDTFYDESLLKMVSINVYDEDTAKMRRVVENLNLKCDVACAFSSNDIFNMSKKMGECQGYPQLYLVDMNTSQIVWHACGWREGFTKEVDEIITAYGER